MVEVHDVHAPEIGVQAELAYFELSTAQEAYIHGKATGVKESAVLISVKNKDSDHIDATAELTVSDAERLAYYILGLCSAVRNA